MKKLVFIIYMIIAIYSIGAEIEGIVNVEGMENYGVFIYIKDEMKYDISDVNGKFLLKKLEKNKEYDLVFQKDEMPDYEMKVLIKEEKQKIKINLRKAESSNKYTTKGTIISNSKEDVFLKFSNKKYGIIVKPKKVFYRELEVGHYETEIIQEGTYKKKIEFDIEAKEINDIGIHHLKQIESNSLDILLKNKINEGHIYLYKNGDLKYVKRITNSKKLIKISELEKGEYTLRLKAYKYKDYEKKIIIDGKKRIAIYLTKEKEKNKLLLKINPSGIKVKLKLFEKNVLLEEKKNVIDKYKFENLDKNKEYRIEIFAEKYKKYIIPRIKVSDEDIEVSMVRKIDGTLLEGTIHPYNAESQIMLLENGDILGKTKVEKNGHYKLEVEKVKDGLKTLRVKAEGFNISYKKIYIKKGEYQKNINIELTPKVSSVFGTVKVSGNEKANDILVIIEELNLWQKTNEKGEYYFKYLPIGKYTLRFQKMGYETKKEKIEIRKKEIAELNLNLLPMAKLIIRSNQKKYKLEINGKKEIIENFVLEKKINLGVKNIKASKKGYLEYKNHLDFSEAGEIKEIKIDFESLYSYKLKLQSQLNEIRGLVEKLEIRAAERKIYEVEKLKNINIYAKQLNEIKIKLKKKKKLLYKTDEDIKKKILKLKNNLKELEGKDIGYSEKERQKIEMKQKILDVLQKTLKEKPYTMLKEEIYTFLGDLYLDLGMIETSEWNYKKANEYKSR